MSSWARIRNRGDRLILAVNHLGVQCDRYWTSDLQIPQFFPSMGMRLMRRALRDWPIQFRGQLEIADEGVEISVIIGHRGFSRLRNLLVTLENLSALRSAKIEIIVVEQSAAPEIPGNLPPEILYVHTPLPHPQMPYCRSWAFNVGARVARGEVLLFHDNDLLAPRDYAAEILARWREGYEIVNLKRFIFYLGAADSQHLSASRRVSARAIPEMVLQNALGGGSIALGREAFFRIGGFDESFVGWGGEDNEFWERAQTLRVWNFGYMPLLHLWHPSPQRFNAGPLTMGLFEQRSSIPPSTRIGELVTRDFGNRQGLDPTFDLQHLSSEVGGMSASPKS